MQSAMVLDCPTPALWAGVAYALMVGGAYLLGVWRGSDPGIGDAGADAASGQQAASDQPPVDAPDTPARRARSGPVADNRCPIRSAMQ
jgi:hypothetical protein